MSTPRNRLPEAIAAVRVDEGGPANPPQNAAIPAAIDVPAGEASPALRLRYAWLAYAAGIAAVGLMGLLKSPAILWTYLIVGFVMTRVVLRRIVVLHPMYDTIANEFSMKISMFLFWPVQMLLLLVKMSVNKVL